MATQVAVVTDSTASLPPGAADGLPLVQVPLQVVIDGRSQPEAPDAATRRQIADALRRRCAMSTSKPSPETFETAYRDLLDNGTQQIVSVHLSAAISGTYDSAVQAAGQFGDRVRVIDSRTVAMGCGFAALAGARLARDRAAQDSSLQVSDGSAAAEGMAAIAQLVTRRARGCEVYFLVPDLEYLRRGGRIGAAAAMLGSSLAIKPLLQVVGGAIGPYERVRTTARAHARLAELAADALRRVDGAADVAIHHLDDESAAHRLADNLQNLIEPGQLLFSEVSAVVGVHVGPGTVGVVISPHDPA
jgi:DegV family protein with EDD domain